MTNVCLIDDHQLFREGLTFILNQQAIKISQECETYAQFSETARKKDWQIVILDLSLPDTTGVVGLEKFREAYPDTPVIVLTMHNEAQFGVRAMQLGASAYISKDDASSSLVDAIKSVKSGKKYMSKRFSDYMVNHNFTSTDQHPHDKLSKREFEVLCLFGSGQTPTEIGVTLSISIKTVSTYRTRILDKLNCANTTEIIRYCLDHALVV